MIAALGAGARVLDAGDVAAHEGPLDHAFRPVLATVGGGAPLRPAHRRDAARRSPSRRGVAPRRGDLAAAEAARRAGGLAVSVLWTVFATGLLAAGLGPAQPRRCSTPAYGALRA